MNKVDFFTPVLYENTESVSHVVQNSLHNYFSLFNGRDIYFITSGKNEDGYFTAKMDKSDHGFWITALKIASYMTIIIPLLMIIAKAIICPPYSAKVISKEPSPFDQINELKGVFGITKKADEELRSIYAKMQEDAMYTEQENFDRTQPIEGFNKIGACFYNDCARLDGLSIDKKEIIIKGKDKNEVSAEVFKAVDRDKNLLDKLTPWIHQSFSADASDDIAKLIMAKDESRYLPHQVNIEFDLNQQGDQIELFASLIMAIQDMQAITDVAVGKSPIGSEIVGYYGIYTKLSIPKKELLEGNYTHLKVDRVISDLQSHKK